MNPITMTQLRRLLPDGIEVIVAEATTYPALAGKKATVSVRRSGVRVTPMSGDRTPIEFGQVISDRVYLSPLRGLVSIGFEGGVTSGVLQLQVSRQENLPPVFDVVVYPDPVLEDVGHAFDSWYAETFWLPRLGPTAWLVAQRLARDPGRVDAVELAEDLGLSRDLRARGMMPRAFTRLEQFHVVRWSHGDLLVPSKLSPLPWGAINRLPARIKAKAKANL